MKQSILIIGESGSGKTTSLRNLPPQNTFYVNIGNKDLPFPGWSRNYIPFTKDNKDGNMLVSSNFNSIKNVLQYVNENRPEIKYIIIDDTNYMSSNEFLKRRKEFGWDKWNDIGGEMGELIFIKDKFRDDLTMIYIFHTEIAEGPNEEKIIKAATMGKMTAKYVNIEGKFTIVLHAKKDYDALNEKTEYVFYTNNYPGSVCKSPMGMFEEDKIPNDIEYVIEKIQEFKNK